MIYKVEIKDIEENIDNFESHDEDSINCLEDAISDLKEVDIWECGEYYEDATGHLYDMITKLKKELAERKNVIDNYIKDLDEALENIEYQRTYGR